MLTLRLGWRNVWRNPRRSLLTVSALAAALAVLMMLASLREGVTRQVLDTGTGLLLGHLQVHQAGYREDRSIHATIGGPAGTDVTTVLRAIEESPGIAAAAPRVMSAGLLSTGRRTTGAQLLGVEPERESRVTTLLRAVHGEGLGRSGPHAVVLGAGLAAELGVGLGDEVAVVVQAADGTIGNELLRVRGLLRTGLAPVDRSLALMALADLQGLLALEPARLHEVAARIERPEQAIAVSRRLGGSGILPAEAAVEPWEHLAPFLADYLRLVQVWSRAVVLIVATFAAFGVLETMLTAVFERTREFGLLASLGLRPSQVVAMVMAETLCLAGLGAGAGLALGAAGTAYLVRFGWDLTPWVPDLHLGGVLLDPHLRGVPAWTSTPWIVVPLVAVSLVAGLVPAVRAARMRPVAALAAPGD